MDADAIDRASCGIVIKLRQRAGRLRGLQIVPHPEQALIASSALAFGEGTELGEPARDRGDEPLLALDVGGDQVKHRSRRLIGAMGAPEALHRLVGTPAALHEVVRSSGVRAR